MTGSRTSSSTPSLACRRQPVRRLRGRLVPVALLFLALAGAGCTTAAPSATSLPVTPAASASNSPQGSAGPRVRYVALGDSFTIGTSVAAPERWPDQLVRAMPALELVANLGVNGYTSRDVIELELPPLPSLEPELVTVLIGVNDIVQGVAEPTYRGNMETILDALTREVGAERVLVVTIPDYTVTPAGADYGEPTTQSAKIRRYNAVATELAAARGITVVDIYDISLDAATDRSLVASDGLHPGAPQYARWVARIAPVMETLLGR